MIKWFFLLLLAGAAYGYELQKEYPFADNTVVSTDLFPGMTHRFEIVRIPPEKTLYRLDAQVIAKTFELHGFPVETKGVRYVTFIKAAPADFAPLEEQVAQIFQQRYPSLRISRVSVTPRGYLGPLPQGAEGVFGERSHLDPEGTFYILGTDGLRRYLDYRVEGTLNVLHTTQKVSRGETLSGQNTLLKPVPLRSFKDTPLTAFPQQTLRYRSALKAGALLSDRNVEKFPLVLKNETVVAVVRNGTVELELIVTATQEGSLYDIITIQKRDGKRSKAKVIGEKRVELQ